MRIGVRKSPHLELLCDSILRAGDVFTSTYDAGADYYLCWGWPQAEQVARDNGGRHERIICVDAHPYALAPGAANGYRIFQLGNWGALAAYPEDLTPRCSVMAANSRASETGPTLVIGQVYTAMQQKQGLVDVWHTGGYGAWVANEMLRPNTKFRKHPRVWAVENPGERQPTLAEDLEGVYCVSTWNSTAGVHAKMAGYPATAAESHGWAHLMLYQLSARTESPDEIRSGIAWDRYRPWLLDRL